MIRALIVLGLVLLAGPAAAKDLPVKVTAARVGLPASGSAEHVTRFAAWAPVSVDLEIASAIGDPAELVVETPDPDEIATTLALPLNLSGRTGAVSAADLGVRGYVRPAGTGEVTITVRKAGGEPLSEPFRVRLLRVRDPLSYVVLSLGGPLNGFELPRPTTGVTEPGLRGGRVELAAISEVSQLPDRWLGYDAADLVVLNTGPGTDEFLRHLFGHAAKRESLLEWVRRGGRLVVGVGANAPVIDRELPALADVLPVQITGNRPSPPVALTWAAR